MLTRLGLDTKILQPIGPTVTGTTTITTGSSPIDMQGFDGALVLFSFGSTAANIIPKLQIGAASDASDAADITGASQAASTSKKIMIDVFRPGGRYLTLSILRTTTTTIDCVWVLLYKAGKQPITNTGTSALDGVVV
jgi:hypothetical protein